MWLVWTGEVGQACFLITLWQCMLYMYDVPLTKFTISRLPWLTVVDDWLALITFNVHYTVKVITCYFRLSLMATLAHSQCQQCFQSCHRNYNQRIFINITSSSEMCKTQIMSKFSSSNIKRSSKSRSRCCLRLITGIFLSSKTTLLVQLLALLHWEFFSC